jgi:hypothetical protein
MYSSTGSSFTASGLTPNTDYYYAIFEYNCQSNPQYLTTTPTTGLITTCGDPTNPPTNSSVTNILASTADLGWDLGVGSSNSIVILREGSAVTAAPTDFSQYTANLAFGSGEQILAGQHVMYVGTGNNITFTNLVGGNTYHYAIYSFNDCNGEPQYYTTASEIGSFTLCGSPEDDPTAHAVTNISSTTAQLNWTIGADGTNTLLVLREAMAVTGAPENTTVYDVDLDFSSGLQDILNAGEFTLYNNTGNSANITGLSANTTYHYALFNFIDCAGEPYYTPTTTAIGSFTTCGAAPTVQTSNININNFGSNNLNFSWTNGNGQNRILVLSENPITGSPNDGTNYVHDLIFDNGQDILNAGEFIVYDGNGTTANVTGLTAVTDYYYAFYEYNCDFSPSYLTPPVTGLVTTCARPTDDPQNDLVANITSSTAQLSWTKGANASNTIVIVKQSDPVDEAPVDGTTYTTDNDFSGTPDDLGSGNLVVYNNTGTSVNIVGLTPNQTYHYTLISFSFCDGNEQYAITSISGSFFTCSDIAPTTPVSSVNVNESAATSLGFSWTNGDGSDRIVVLSTSAIAGMPVDGTIYDADAQFNNGQDELNAGEYIVFNGTGNSFTATGLTAATTYHYAIFEYNCDIDPKYLTPAVTGTATTCSAPTDEPSASAISNLTSFSATISWAKGADASNTLLVMSTSPIAGTPVNGTTYSPSVSFGSGNTIAAGEFVMSNGTGSSTNVLNLTAGTVYYFTLFSYNLCGGTPQYLTTPVESDDFRTNFSFNSIAGADLAQTTGWESDDDNDHATSGFAGTFNQDSTDFFVNDLGSFIMSDLTIANGVNSSFYIRTNSSFIADNELNTTVTLQGSGNLIIHNAVDPTIITTPVPTTSTITYGGAAVSVRPMTHGNMVINKDIPLSGNTVVGSLLTLNNILNLNGNLLTLNGTITGAGTLSSTNSSLTIGGSGNLGTINFAAAPNNELTNLTINKALLNGNNVVTLGTDLQVNGTATFSNGILAINGRTLTFSGTSTTSFTSGFLRGSAASNIIVEGTGTLGNLRFQQTSADNRTLNNLTVRKNVGLQASSSLIVAGNLIIDGGNFSINSNTLTLNGNFTHTSGSITGSTTSNLTVAGSGVMTDGLVFNQTTPGTTNAIATFTVNRPNEIISLGSDLAIQTLLTISTSSTLSNGGFGITDNASATLTVNDDATLQLEGTTELPAFTTTNLNRTSNVVYAGTNQTVTTATYGNLTISNTGTASLSGTGATLQSDLKINPAATFDMAGNSFILGSDALGTAAILEIEGTLSNATNVTHNRFISGADGWRVLATPLLGQSLTGWNDDIETTGFPGSNYPSFSFVSVYFYDEAEAVTQTNSELGYVAPSNLSDALPNGADNSGVWYYVFSDAHGAMPKTFDMTGTVRQGSVTINGLSDGAGETTYSGWHVVGNPYPCPIVWDNVGKTNLSAFAYTYSESSGVVSALGAGQTIASGEGFIVQATSDGASISFEENDKQGSQTSDTYNNRLLDNETLALNIDMVQGSIHEKAKLFLHPDATENFDNDFDASKFDNFLGKTNMALVSEWGQDMEYLGVNDTASLNIPIRIYRPSGANTNKTHTISFSNVAKFIENGKCLGFEDVVAGISFPITKDTSYTFVKKENYSTARLFLKVSSPIKVNAQNLTCANDASGSIEVESTLASSFSWTKDDEPYNATGNVINNLSVGYYEVQASGNFGHCNSVKYIAEISQPEDIRITETINNIHCHNGNDASIELITEGGTGTNYTYNWSDGKTTAVNSNLAAGNYIVSIYDEAGCEKIVDYTIENPIETQLTGSVINTSCASSVNGSIQPQIMDANGTAFTFEWSNGENTEEITNLSVGNYEVTVTDEFGCKTTSSFEVSSDNVEVVISSLINDASCYSEANGSVVVEVISAAGNSYTYHWSNGDNNSTASNLSAGVYSLTVVDNVGCEKTAEFIVDEPNEIITEFAMSTDTLDLATGNIVYFENQTVGANEFVWNFDNGNISTDLNPWAQYTTEGVYTIELQADNNGCVVTSNKVLVVTQTTGIAIHSNDYSLKVFAVGNKAMMNFESVENKNATIKIYNVYGQAVFEETKVLRSGQYEFELPQTTGVYIMNVAFENHQKTFKLIVNN